MRNLWFQTIYKLHIEDQETITEEGFDKRSRKKCQITLKFQKVQYPKGASDCGVYLMAFATEFIYGNNTSSCEYEQTNIISNGCLLKTRLYTSKSIKPGK